MTLRICPLFSGSKGNATLVQGGNTQVLVDAGVSAKRLEEGLLSVGCQPQELSAILITHEHTDHIAGLDVFASRYGIKVYANAPTHDAMANQLKRLPLHLRTYIRPDSDFMIGSLNVEAYSTPHDAAHSQGYGFYCQGLRGALVTDLGYMPAAILDRLKGVNLLLLESNHDEEMLLTGPYPSYLKNRIAGRKGHLSNLACGNALRSLIASGARQVALMHLSAENNLPSLAHKTVCKQLLLDDIQDGRDVHIFLSRQDGCCGALEEGEMPQEEHRVSL